MEYVPLSAEQAASLLVALGEDLPGPDDRFGLITDATEDGRLVVQVAVIGPLGPQSFWTGIEWAPL